MRRCERARVPFLLFVWQSTRYRLMNPKLRRLTADADLLRTEFAGHPNIQVIPIGAEPAEQYRVHYRIPGVVIDPTTRQPAIAQSFTALISLTANYPREKPYCTMQSAIFHPNFGPNIGDEICIGDFWTPAQTLPDIIVKVGEMIQFQLFNIKSPLNAVAARWTAEHPDAFPVGTLDLYQAEPGVRLAPTTQDDGLSASTGTSEATFTAQPHTPDTTNQPWWTEPPVPGSTP